MSQYHKHCGTSSTPAKKSSRNKKHKAIPKVIPKTIEPESKPTNVLALLTTKAFCDCSHCACRDCPDILKLLSITVSDTTCHFGSKVSDQAEIPQASKPATSTLLDIVNPERNCNCGVVARGIRDHIHMNLSMTRCREKFKDQMSLCDEHCAKLAKGTKPTAPKNSLVTKDNTAPAEDTTPVEKCPLCDPMSNTT